MKKKIILFSVLVVSSICIYAQETNKEWRKKFINLSFTNATISQDNVQDLKSNYGVAFTVGRTFFLHKPIGDMLRFGIDATWFDINYSNYEIEHITYLETDKYQYHQGEISLHVGPSVTFEPIKNSQFMLISNMPRLLPCYIREIAKHVMGIMHLCG